MQVNSTTTIAEEFQQHIKRETQRDKIMRIAPVLVLGVLIVVFSFLAPGFLSGKNAIVLLNQLSIPLIVATGITFVILIGSIDLSVDGVMGLTSAVVGLLVLNNKTLFNLGVLGILIAILVGGLCGLVTGIIFVKGKIPSFMVSFGMLSITSGLAILSYNAIPPMIQDNLVRSFALTKIAGLPLYFYVSILVFLLALLIQEKTAFGKYIFAIGENEDLAKVSGINVDAVKIKVFIWTGLIIGVAGVMGAAQIGRGDASVGVGMLFPALAAVVLGGTSLSGGKGGLISTLIGTMIITVVNNGLILIGINPYFKSAIIGLILIAAVTLTVKRGRKAITK